MSKLPVAKSTDIVVQELDGEILIYDLNTHKAYNLNETSGAVFLACDGKTTIDELRVRTKFTDDIIFLALDELKEENLLKENQIYSSPFAGMSRREAIRKVGLASMIALPVISSLIAPTAAMAQSSGSACVNSGGAPSGTPVNNIFSASCASCRNGLNTQCCSGAVSGFGCFFDPGIDFYQCSAICD